MSVSAVRADDQSDRAKEKDLERQIYEVEMQAREVKQRSEELKRQQQEIKIELIRTLQDQAEISEDLRDLLVDYHEYFAEEQSAVSKATATELLSLAEALQHGRYIQQYGKLNAELATLQDKLRKAEEEFRSTENQRKAARLSRSLQREIEIYRDLLDEHGEMKVLISGLAKEMAQLSTEVSHEVIVNLMREGGPKEFVDVVVDPNDSGQLIIRMPKLRQEPFVVTPPRAALPPIASPATLFNETSGQRRISTQPGGNLSLVQKLMDSVRIVGDQPVELTVPTGVVEVTGVSGDMLRVTSKVEMISDKRRTLEQLAGDIRLVLSAGEGRIVAQTFLPNLNSSETNVSRVKTIVEMPQRCELIANSSFGSISITEIENDVTVTGRHSAITVRQIDGDLVANNHMASVDASYIDGKTRITNHCGPVMVSHCDDDVFITNAQATISVANCDGNLEVHSDGPVDVTYHVGDILIRNNTGPVTLTRVEGDVDASTSFGPATATDVSGDVILTTASAPLSASGITGSLTATNRSAVLSVSSVVGPLTISNKGGNTIVTLREAPNGPSTISSSYGLVNLTLPRNADMTVASRLVQGTFDTSLPVEVSEDGNVKVTKMSLGNGSRALTIDGTKSTVVVSQGP